MWGTDSPWHKVEAKLLKISQVVTWGNVPVIHAFETYGRNNASKDSGIDWFLLRCDTLQRHNEKLRAVNS